ncbi:MAG TPA: hypothetical protein VKH17_02445, partial [Acidimicrobiia bacterium]|nr:hypothetical protein [Acidimicrobiia bacterium]
MSDGVDLQTIAQQLLDAYENATMLKPTTAAHAEFDSADAYEVLDRIAAFRSREGWELVGRKIGFTSRTIWARYGVDRPMWAHIWSRTVVQSVENRAEVSLDRFVQPRIEPEVVFKLRRPLGRTDGATGLARLAVSAGERCYISADLLGGSRDISEPHGGLAGPHQNGHMHSWPWRPAWGRASIGPRVEYRGVAGSVRPQEPVVGF